MIRAIIFDLDGTLVDTEMLWVRGLEDYLHAAGFAMSHEEAVGLVFGRAWHDIYRELRRRYPAFRVPVDEAAAELNRRFEARKQGVDVRIHESIERLRSLAAAFPVCIVSGSGRREIAAAVELMGIEDHVRFFLGSEDYSPGKPDPACFLKAAERLGVDPADCLVFEDSAAGVRAAKAAGMRCVALQRPGLPQQDLSPADRVVDSLARPCVADLIRDAS